MCKLTRDVNIKVFLYRVGFVRAALGEKYTHIVMEFDSHWLKAGDEMKRTPTRDVVNVFENLAKPGTVAYLSPFPASVLLDLVALLPWRMV